MDIHYIVVIRNANDWVLITVSEEFSFLDILLIKIITSTKSVQRYLHFLFEVKVNN